MSNYIVFGTFDSRNYDGLEIFEKNTKTIPARQYEKFEVPGKNGKVLFDLGTYEDVPQEYSFIVWKNVSAVVVAMRNALLSLPGYQRLSDSFDTDEFYSAYYDGAMTIQYSRGRNHAKGTFRFTRKPQRFLVSGETTQTVTAASATISNPTLFASNPIIRVTGNGSFTVNGETITVSGNTDYIDIDCELKDCYNGNTNMNGAVSFASGTFPTLIPGNNSITKTGITSLAFTPNWWRL